MPFDDQNHPRDGGDESSPHQAGMRLGVKVADNCLDIEQITKALEICPTCYLNGLLARSLVAWLRQIKPEVRDKKLNQFLKICMQMADRERKTDDQD